MYVGQMAIKYTNIFHCKNPQKFTQIGMFGSKRCHLATLASRSSNYLRTGGDVSTDCINNFAEFRDRLVIIPSVRREHRNLRTRTRMLAQVLQIFFGEITPCKKLADRHPT
jgi:hypothetical protein